MATRVSVTNSDRVWIERASTEAASSIATLSSQLASLGLTVLSELDATVTVIVRTRAASRLAALLGPSTTAAQLERLGVARSVRWLEESDVPRLSHASNVERAQLPTIEAVRAIHDDPAALNALVARAELSEFDALARSAEATVGPERAALLAAMLRDPRLVDRRVRARLVEGLARDATAESLGLLAGALLAHRGAGAMEESLAIGRLLASGLTRWPTRGPFAVEFDDPRDEAPAALIALAIAAGAYERLHDERGVTVHRAVVGEVPWIEDDGASLPASLLLVRALESYDGARVWLGGISFPASLPWSIWCALLGQRARR